MMTHAEIENWVLSVLDRVKKGIPVEDDHVELKLDWPPVEKAARRIAGLANASRGQHTLLIIGVDEKNGVVVAPQNEFSSWWNAVMARFDGRPPTPTCIGVDSVYGVLFEPADPPYVVRNEAFGEAGGGPVEFEVPWREGTSVRSARHLDLIRLLVPHLHTLGIETLGARAMGIRNAAKNTWDLLLDVTLYLVPRGRERVVLPFHKNLVLVRHSQGDESMSASLRLVEHSISASETIRSGPGELIVDGPGKVALNAGLSTSEPLDDISILSVTCRLSPAPQGDPSVTTFELARLPGGSPDRIEWILNP